MSGHGKRHPGAHGYPPSQLSRHAANERRSVRSRQARAVLAGGLVLGIGATVTLAYWNSSEFGAAEFQAGVFATESRPDGGSWANHPVGSPATLVFDGNEMSPSVSKYAYLDVRTTSTTTVDGTISLDAVVPSGALSPVLQYRAVVTAPDTTCDEDAFTSGSTWVAGGTETYLFGSDAVPTPSQPSAIVKNAGSTLRYCLDVRIEPGASSTYQGESGTLTWGFLATFDE